MGAGIEMKFVQKLRNFAVQLLGGNRRIDFIRKYVTGKAVLDLGVVQHSIENIDDPNWLHREIVRYAKNVLGVDILAEEVEHLNELGFDVMCADVEQMELGRKFDVIIAGELIEHLDNSGLFLQTVKRHLEEDGIIILTTPNPFTLGNAVIPIKLLLGGDYSVNKEHKCWYCLKTLRQLLEKYGFKIIEQRTISRDRYSSVKRFIQTNLTNVAPAIFIVAQLSEEYDEV